ncbi:cache domain-containing sensor histidine kinase [Salipaludibacillus sp. CF4.18]|uniref:cache domain-containing sensor histidine kinase n=1 Tax=Salipaludibacillus sp. CF4.18 TaxID=3373081 RepID=UPI003EE46E74
MKSFSLKMKLFITITIVNVIIISIIAIAIYISNVNEMKKQAESLSNILSTQFSRTIDLYFQDIERLSLAIFTDPYLQESLLVETKIGTAYEAYLIKNSVYNLLFNHVYPRKDIERITIYTNENIAYEYVKQGNVDIIYLLEEQKWKKELDSLEKSEFMLLPTTETTLANGEKRKVVSLVRNIYNIPQRQKIGSMKIDINIDAFTNLLEFEDVNELEEYMQLLIMNQDQNVIFDYDEELTGAKIDGFERSIFLNQSDGGELVWKEDQYLYTYNKSPQTGWDTIILIDDDFIIYERNQILLFIFSTGLIAIVLIALVSYFLSYQIAKPLRELTLKMEGVEQGDLTERMNFTGNKEMDIVTRVYNNMLESINRLIREVYESKITEKNAKISALQSQINPHFLYNTLNVMKAISRVKQVEEVAEISESLSDLFKYTMKDLDKPVPLKEELDHINNYINIQKHRFMDRFILVSDVQEGAEETFLPKLSIQPIIENAINHGLADKKMGGIVELNVLRDRNTVLIQVKDNGNGIEPEKLKQIENRLSYSNPIETEAPHMGVGLINIQQRIRLMYGPTFGLEIRSEVGSGTITTLKIPYNSENDLPEGRGH